MLGRHKQASPAAGSLTQNVGTSTEVGCVIVTLIHGEQVSGCLLSFKRSYPHREASRKSKVCVPLSVSLLRIILLTSNTSDVTQKHRPVSFFVHVITETEARLEFF